MKVRLFLFVLICISYTSFAQVLPKREFRAAWIATVSNIDFPSSKTLTPEQQRAEFINILNQHQQTGINAVIVQIRPTCDALYASSFEPWSEWLTGKQGQAPQPFYDPLVFMIAECRKRGMEFHAWFNPYRAVSNVKTAKLDSTKHIAVRRPDLLLAYGDLRVLDPGKPEARNFVTNVVMDVVRRYDVDAIHFDDYFYPYPETGKVLNDDSTFSKFNRGISNRADWRRDNVDLLVRQVSDSIKSTKPWVKFGISPFGIWQNKTTNQPNGSATNGLQGYNDIYADARKWVQQGWVDYIAPQLYWSIGFAVADYGILLPWWSQNSFGRHLYIGQAAYRVNTMTTSEPSAWLNGTQLPTQIRANRIQPAVQGSIFYNTTSLNKNPLGLRDSLRTNLYRYPALIPNMAWKDNIPPPAPQGLTATITSNGVQLRWNRPSTGTSELEKIRYYVVYRFANEELTNTSAAQNIRYISPNDTTAYLDAVSNPTLKYTYVITAVDRLHNESVASAPASVVLITALDQQLAPQTELLTNYPNPFEEETLIPYQLAKSGRVRLKIWNLLGQEITTLVDEWQAQNSYQISFRRNFLPSGVYICTLETDDFKGSKRMVLR